MIVPVEIASNAHVPQELPPEHTVIREANNLLYSTRKFFCNWEDKSTDWDQYGVRSLLQHIDELFSLVWDESVGDLLGHFLETFCQSFDAALEHPLQLNHLDFDQLNIAVGIVRDFYMDAEQILGPEVQLMYPEILFCWTRRWIFILSGDDIGDIYRIVFYYGFVVGLCNPDKKSLPILNTRSAFMEYLVEVDEQNNDEYYSEIEIFFVHALVIIMSYFLLGEPGLAFNFLIKAFNTDMFKNSSIKGINMLPWDFDTDYFARYISEDFGVEPDYIDIGYKKQAIYTMAELDPFSFIGTYSENKEVIDVLCFQTCSEWAKFFEYIWLKRTRLSGMVKYIRTPDITEKLLQNNTVIFDLRNSILSLIISNTTLTGNEMGMISARMNTRSALFLDDMCELLENNGMPMFLRCSWLNYYTMIKYCNIQLFSYRGDTEEEDQAPSNEQIINVLVILLMMITNEKNATELEEIASSIDGDPEIISSIMEDVHVARALKLMAETKKKDTSEITFSELIYDLAEAKFYVQALRYLYMFCVKKGIVEKYLSRWELHILINSFLVNEITNWNNINKEMYKGLARQPNALDISIYPKDNFYCFPEHGTNSIRKSVYALCVEGHYQTLFNSLLQYEISTDIGEISNNIQELLDREDVEHRKGSFSHLGRRTDMFTVSYKEFAEIVNHMYEESSFDIKKRIHGISLTMFKTQVWNFISMVMLTESIEFLNCLKSGRIARSPTLLKKFYDKYKIYDNALTSEKIVSFMPNMCTSEEDDEKKKLIDSYNIIVVYRLILLCGFSNGVAMLNMTLENNAKLHQILTFPTFLSLAFDTNQPQSIYDLALYPFIDGKGLWMPVSSTICDLVYFSYFVFTLQDPTNIFAVVEQARSGDGCFSHIALGMDMLVEKKLRHIKNYGVIEELTSAAEEPEINNQWTSPISSRNVALNLRCSVGGLGMNTGYLDQVAIGYDLILEIGELPSAPKSLIRYTVPDVDNSVLLMDDARNFDAESEVFTCNRHCTVVSTANISNCIPFFDSSQPFFSQMCSMLFLPADRLLFGRAITPYISHEFSRNTDQSEEKEIDSDTIFTTFDFWENPRSQ